ncbi:hypothetical protein [Roseospira visakhapatnamensis]|uniref:Uncharacterized protein n=1 Tax=Roseospira visakhapatnamensis TaxID=390880 RepID=A0A7W6RCZ0_9PROT|nr:hypothetical protein [Roseospira visakhapatnamensis]MBB4266291.1 hypothetical protein [Roseospira visakhapatnamensis]
MARGLSGIRAAAALLDTAGPPGTDLVHVNGREIGDLAASGYPMARAPDGTVAVLDRGAVAARGRRGDTDVIHAGRQAQRYLRARGGAGTINPATGRREFFDAGSDDDGSDDDGSDGGSQGGSQGGADKGSDRKGGNDGGGSDGPQGSDGGRSGGSQGGSTGSGRSGRSGDVGKSGKSGKSGGPGGAGGSRGSSLATDDAGSTLNTSSGARQVSGASLTATDPEAAALMGGHDLGALAGLPSEESIAAGLAMESVGQTIAREVFNTLNPFGLDINPQIGPTGLAHRATFDPVGMVGSVVGGVMGVPGLGLVGSALGPDIDLGLLEDLPDAFSADGRTSNTRDFSGDGAGSGRDRPLAAMIEEALEDADDDASALAVEERAYILPSYVRPDTMQDSEVTMWDAPKQTGLAGIVADQGRYGDTALAYLGPQAQRRLRARGGAGTINPATGRREFFDEQYYLSQNPDVRAAVANGDFASAQDHYNAHGRAEGRYADSTDAHYLSRNQDVAAAVRSGQFSDAREHYALHGASEGRSLYETPDGFDAQAYLDQNRDVAESGMDPWTHYRQHGMDEGRAYTAPQPEPTPQKDPGVIIQDILDKFLKDYFPPMPLPTEPDPDPDGNSDGTPDGNSDGNSDGTPDPGGPISPGPVITTPRYRSDRYRGTKGYGF